MSSIHTSQENAASVIESVAEHVIQGVSHEARSRSFRIANELQNSLNMVLRGQRSGRRYNIPGSARMTYKKGKRVLVGYEAGNYGRKGRKIYRREAGTAKITHAQYTASAAGEPPAVRTGAFRGSWRRKTYVQNGPNYGFEVRGVTESALRVGKKGYLLGDLLEGGASRMAPRPYKQRTIDRAAPNVMRILRAPYVVK